MEGEAYCDEAARFPMLNATRNEADFAKNIENIIATDRDKGWVFVLDNLQYCCFGLQMSETLVWLIAEK